MKPRTVLRFVLFFTTGLLFFTPPSGITHAVEKIKLGLTSAGAPGTTTELAADLFKQLVEKRSDQTIEVIRYAAGELYKDKEACEAIACGSVQMAMLSGPVVSIRSRILEVICGFAAQGLWGSIAHYRRFIDNPEINKIASKEFQEKYNCKLLGLVAYGPSVVGAIRPIHSIADYRNLKIRTIGKAQATLYKTLGSAPTELSSFEIYMALQRGLIDGATTGPARFLKSKLYEVTPYITQDYTMPELPFVLVINMEEWKKLSPEYHKLFQEAAAEVVTWSRAHTVKETEKSYEKLRQKKEVEEIFFLPKPEQKKLTNLVTPAMKQYIAKRIGGKMANKLLLILESTRWHSE